MERYLRENCPNDGQGTNLGQIGTELAYEQHVLGLDVIFTAFKVLMEMIGRTEGIL